MQLVYMLHLSNYNLFCFTVSDIFFILLTLYIFVKQRIALERYHLLLLLFWFITGVFSLLNLYAYAYFFSFEDFILPYTKFTFYVVAFIILPPYFANNFDRLNKIIVNSLIILCGLGIYQLIAHYFFPFLPYSLQPEMLHSTLGYDSMVSYQGVFRIRSIYAEPAHFSIHINLLYAYLLHNKIRLKLWVHLLIIGTVGFTLALSGIGLLVLNYFLLSIKNNVIKTKKALLYSIVFIGLLAIIISNNFIVTRIAGIIHLTDTKRLLGGFELAKDFPFYGIGIGNLENFYYSLNKTFEHATSWTIQNIIPIILSYSGIGGLILFLSFLYQLNKNNIFLGIFLFGAFFTTGAFNATSIWLFLILIATGNIYKNLSKKTVLGKNDCFKKAN